MSRPLILLVGLAVAGCEAPPNRNSAVPSAEAETTSADADNALSAADALANNSPGTASAAISRTGWSYSEKKDEMRGNVARFARLSALEPISLDFPYGESTPELVIRQDPKYGFDIYITANGQFLCRSYDNDTISVKFDNGGIEQWACGDAEGGSSDIIFVVNAEGFLAKLRKAKRMIVEADMYQAGRQQMKFEVSGLKWGKASEPSGD
ncbi:MAG TPA: hypothetical protein VFZ91_14875 [Allosphingosinicella sp.]